MGGAVFNMSCFASRYNGLGFGFLAMSGISREMGTSTSIGRAQHLTYPLLMVWDLDLLHRV